jgi:hypothetical protein
LTNILLGMVTEQKRRTGSTKIMIKYDAFLSYAGEDSKFATEIVGGLKSRGFKVWYAPLQLKVGQILLDSVEKGMRESRSGILLLSSTYLSKGWTNYEMDILIRQSIEKKKKLFPIWHGVTKEDVESRHIGLCGIVSLKSELGLHIIIARLAEEMSDGAPTICVVPSYSSPKFRFLQGRGEIKIHSEDGPSTTLWELLLHLKDDEYPIYLEGELFTKNDLFFQAAQLLPHIPEVVENWVQAKGREELWKMCKDAGFDPELFT